MGYLGRHKEALDLLTAAPLAGERALAREYCRDHHARAPSLYVQLLERYLSPSSSPPSSSSSSSSANANAAAGATTPGAPAASGLESACELLKEWPADLSAVEALKRLPPTLPIAQVEGALAHVLRSSQERLRHSQVRASLLRAVSLQTRAQLQAKRGGRLVVTDETACIVCGRRIGNAAFTWVASAGTFAHIGCDRGGGAGAGAGAGAGGGAARAQAQAQALALALASPGQIVWQGASSPPGPELVTEGTQS